MADEEDAPEGGEENELDGSEQQPGGKKKLFVFGGIGLVLIAIGIFAVPMIMNMISPPEEEGDEGEAVAEVTDGPPIYQSLHPPLVVNFKDEAGDSHYMQITLEVMSREQTTINSVRDNTAAIRNALILHYSSSIYEEVNTRDGKEKMLADGLTEIQRVMLDTTGDTGIEAVYFTALVIQ